MANPPKKPKPNPPPPSSRQTRSSAHPSPTSPLRMSPPPAASSSSSSSRTKAKAREVITIEDSDGGIVVDESEDSQVEFVYESDVVISDDEEEDGMEFSVGIEPMSVSEGDDNQQGPPSPPPESIQPRGKGNSRKVYRDDITRLIELYGSTSGQQVKGLRREGDESINFTLVTPARKHGLMLVIMTPEVAGYPAKAQHLCYAEEDIDSATEGVLAEIPSLPPQADRSLSGVINHLKLRLILREPSPWANMINQDPSDNEYESDEDMFGLGVGEVSEQVAAFTAALRKDMRQILDAGYRCGFHRVSELDHVVVCSVRVHDLGVPLRALQAWDSSLITGEVVYLVMLLNFGARYPVNMDDMSRGQVRIKIGLSPRYKPDHQAIGAAFRNHSSAYTAGEFESFALSAPLDSLFAEKFQEIVACRRQFAVGWAGAEQHAFALGGGPKASVDKKAAAKADKEEKKAATSYTMPVDPQANDATSNNFPFTAFTYLIRRFIMCPKFCLICYKETEFSSLKPFVCQNDLCLFQLMNLDLAVSLENELLTKAASVDLLVSLCYSAAIEHGLKDASHFPVGLALQVPERTPWVPGDPTLDFDTLTSNEAKCKGIHQLIAELPKISAMRDWILKKDVPETDKVLYHARKLQDMPGIGGKTVSPSAWKLLRWIVASCTSYLKEITEGDELVQGLSKQYRQFKLLVGSPIKEHQLAEHVATAKAKNANAARYPTLHAFHGSSVKNWHTILREGLHFRETINGRAYGHGIYFAKQGDVSLGHYSQPAGSSWKQSEFTVGKVAAICEIVNLPTEYVSQNPYLVVQHTEWVQARYLVVAKSTSYSDVGAEGEAAGPHEKGHYIEMDPAHPLTLASAKVLIPDVLPKLEELNKKLVREEDPLNDSDDEMIKDTPVKSSLTPSAVKPLKSKRSLGVSSSLASVGEAIKGRVTRATKVVSNATADEQKPFVPVGQEIISMVRLLPPPKTPNRGALLAVTKEIKAMVDEQDHDGPVKCGFYFDPERSNDNAFVWLVEMPVASFDQSIPLVADCKDRKVTSILFEIRFGESYPLAPPFFRVVWPRFLPFIQGGGGHVTGGGSICMDLLTPNAWNPVYTISAVLLQIRMAMSNLEPRPARLDSSMWNQPYSMAEAIEGFKRAASTHGWSVPDDLDKMRF